MSALLLLLLLAAEPAPSLAAAGPRLGCGTVLHVATLDGLLPRVAAAECHYLLPDPNDPADQRVAVPGIRVIGNGPFGPPTVTICLLMDNGSGAELVTTREEFFLRFAPVESPDEARAFVHLLTGLSTDDAAGAPLPIEETKAGFVIRNVVVPSVGCIVKPPSTATLTVTRGGDINASDWRTRPGD